MIPRFPRLLFEFSQTGSRAPWLSSVQPLLFVYLEQCMSKQEALILPNQHQRVLQSRISNGHGSHPETVNPSHIPDRECLEQIKIFR